MTGRPSEFTQEIADKICGELAEGRSLRSVCIPDDMPAVRTVFYWLRKYPEFLQQYARAKDESADALADEMLDIADDGSNDWMETNKPGCEGWVENGEAMQRSRLRVDTRKWIASKLKPKKYGDKVDMTHSGPGGGPIPHVIELTDLSPLVPAKTPEEGT